MQPIKGKGTITFDDGTTFDVDADIKFSVDRGLTSGNGIIRSDQIFSAGMKDGGPILTCGSQKIRIFLTQTDSRGFALVKTSGPFLP